MEIINTHPFWKMKNLPSLFKHGILSIQHCLHIHTNLQIFRNILICRCALADHPFRIILHDPCKLKPHICLIDCVDIMYFLSKTFYYINAVCSEILYNTFRFPAAFTDNPLWAAEVMQCHHRFYPVFSATGNHIPIMLYLIIIEYPLLRLNPCPFNRESVCIVTCLRHHRNIPFIEMVMIHGIQTGFLIGSILHMFHSPYIVMDIIPLYLMRRRCCSQQKVL